MIYSSLHNHTVWSDGLNTVEEIVLAAKNAGLREIGISDHWVSHPTLPEQDWCVQHDKLDAYIDACLAARAKYQQDDFKVRIAMEVDFFEENALETNRLLRQYPLDYQIGAVHFDGEFFLDHSPKEWAPLTQDDIDVIWHDYWEKMEKMVRSGLFAFAAHLDVPKKYNCRPSYDDSPEAFNVLQALADMRMPFELNTAGWYKLCKEAYPSATILKRAAELKLPCIVNADAHYTKHITRGFRKAEVYLSQFGITPASLSLN